MRKLVKANNEDVDKEWREHFNTLKAIHAKASGEWRGLKIRKEMSKSLHMEGLSPEQTVIALVYWRLSANNNAQNPLRREYVNYYNSIEPKDEWLARKWIRQSEFK